MRNFFTIADPHRYHPVVVKYFKRNFYANFLDAGFWFFGDSFVAAYTILPVFMSTLTDSPVIIGLIPALTDAGWFLPQIFFARYLETVNRRLPVVLKFGIFDRLPFLLLAIGAFLIPRLEINFAVALFLVIYMIKTFSSGLVALPWQELIATVIPVSHRGRYWGYALIFGKITGILGSLVTGYLLTNIAYPRNYGIMYLIGFGAVTISYIFLTRNIEPAIDRTSNSEGRTLNTWGKMKAILKQDSNFRTYLVNRGFIFMGWMGIGFVSVYGIQEFNLPLSYSAIFTGVMFVFQILGYTIWGNLGDRKGYKRVIEFSNSFFILGIFILLFVESVLGLYLVFGIISFAYSGEYIADQNIAMEFGGEVDRPTYIGMSKTLTGPFLLISPILGGGLVKLLGYPNMFLISLIFACIAFVIVRFFVVEPRLTK
jgi:MFS family permease